MCTNHKLKVLSEIATVFNKHNLTWAVGASTLLYLKNITDTFHDIDILLDEKDVEQARTLLLALGEQHVNNSSLQYKSKAFLEFSIKEVDIDIIAGFVIVNDDIEYYYPLKASDITEKIHLHGEAIPLHSVSAWRTYYFLMNRTEKLAMIDHISNRKDNL